MKKLILTVMLASASSPAPGFGGEEVHWDKAPTAPTTCRAAERRKLFVNYCLNCHFRGVHALQPLARTSASPSSRSRDNCSLCPTRSAKR
jgi:hypothetical protein